MDCDAPYQASVGGVLTKGGAKYFEVFFNGGGKMVRGSTPFGWRDGGGELKEINTYISRRKNKVDQYIIMRPIMYL